MLAAEVFCGQSGQCGFAGAVGSEYDGTWPGGIPQSSVQPLQGRRVLWDVPSNRHRRILLRAVPVGRAKTPYVTASRAIGLPLADMRPERDSASEWAVCVYCASGPMHPELLELAAELGEAIAERGWTLVWGGGQSRRWVRWPAQRGPAADGPSASSPKMLMRREIADAEADELIVTDTMRERKQIMEDRADAFIVLPGGIGTLGRVVEAWTTGYLGMHHKPMVMLDPWGHYEGLWLWLCGLVDSGYISQAAMDRLVLVDKVSAAVEACAPA